MTGLVTGRGLEEEVNISCTGCWEASLCKNSAKCLLHFSGGTSEEPTSKMQEMLATRVRSLVGLGRSLAGRPGNLLLDSAWSILWIKGSGRLPVHRLAAELDMNEVT